MERMGIRMADDEMLRLKNQLCFPLYACAREVTKQYKPFLDEIGLTYTQYITMMVLWEKKAVSVKELGKILYLDSGTLTPLLKKMEAEGLVVRRRNQADERSVVAEITQAGERLKERAAEIPGKILHCIHIDRADAATLYRLRYQILARIQDTPPTPRPGAA